MDHSFTNNNTIHAFYLRTHSLDGTTTDYTGIHLQLTTTYDPKRMKGWVGLVGWLTVHGLPT